MTILGGGKIKLLLKGVTFWWVKDIGLLSCLSLGCCHCNQHVQ